MRVSLKVVNIEDGLEKARVAKIHLFKEGDNDEKFAEAERIVREIFGDIREGVEFVAKGEKTTEIHIRPNARFLEKFREANRRIREIFFHKA